MRAFGWLLAALMVVVGLVVQSSPWAARAQVSPLVTPAPATPLLDHTPSPLGTPVATPRTGFGVAPVVPGAGLTDPPEVRAVWVDAFHDGVKTPRQIDELVDWARSAHLNALFVQVRRRGDAYYLKGTEPRSEDPELQPGFDALAYLIERAHGGDQPLQVHAWLGTLAVWHKRDEPPLDPAHVFNRHGLVEPMEATWLQLRDDGEAWTGTGASGTYYLDAGHPDAARYTAEVYLNVLRNYAVDGIHLDHARYFEGHGLDRRWGYNPTSLARFNAFEGRESGDIPDASDPAWMAWRRNQVTALVRRIYLEAKAINPRVVVSAAVIPWGDGPQQVGGWDNTAPASAVFQDWRYWLAEGIVDYVLPMNYFRETDVQRVWFDNWVRWQQENRGARGVVIGAGAYLNAPDETLAQLARARVERPLGVALYSYANLSNGGAFLDGEHAHVAALLRSLLFPHPAPVPALPWIEKAVNGSVLVDVPGVEGARVTLVGPATIAWRTDGTGLAGGQELPPGYYTLTVDAPGVDPVPLAVVVEPGEVAVVRFGVGHPVL